MTTISSTFLLFNELFNDPRRHVDFLRKPEQFLNKRGLQELLPYVPELLERSFPQFSCHLDTAIICLTEHCNLNCIHCSINASPWAKKHIEQDILRKSITQLANLKVRVVKFTGGEPMTYPHIEKFILQALQAGLFVEIETSGTLLTDDFLKNFDGFQEQMRFAIGFDSLNAKTYERFRNTPGAFNLVNKGFALLGQYGFSVKIMTVLSTMNHHEIPDIIDWTLSAFNNKGFHRLLPVLSSFGRGKSSSAETGLDAVRLHDFLHNEYFPLFQHHIAEAKEPRINIGLPLALIPFDMPIYPICGCGTQKIGITPKGKVGLCHLIEGHDFAISGTVTEPLEKQWLHGTPFKAMRLLERSDIKGICSECRFFRACMGGCRIHANTVYGNPSYSDPTCQSFQDSGLFPTESLLATIAEKSQP